MSNQTEISGIYGSLALACASHVQNPPAAHGDFSPHCTKCLDTKRNDRQVTEHCPWFSLLFPAGSLGSRQSGPARERRVVGFLQRFHDCGYENFGELQTSVRARGTCLAAREQGLLVLLLVLLRCMLCANQGLMVPSTGICLQSRHSRRLRHTRSALTRPYNGLSTKIRCRAIGEDECGKIELHHVSSFVT